MTEQLGASSFRSVADMWHHRVTSTPAAEAMTFRQHGQWRTISWREADVRVRAIANGLLQAGIQPEDRCSIIANTRLEWVLADIGILCAGGATTTIYPSSPPEDLAYIVRDSGSVVVFAEDDTQVAKLHQIRAEIPDVRQVIVLNGRATSDGWVTPLSAFESAGEAWGADNPDAYDAASKGIAPERIATVIYTSGTTGLPKGVRLTHDSWVYEAEAIDALRVMTPADKQVLFLPLSHVFAKVLQVLFIRLGVPTVIDGDMDSIRRTLAETRPTWSGGVPRIFEKFYDAIHREMARKNPVERRMFNWAIGIGRQVSVLREQGEEPGPVLRAQWRVADRVVFQRIKALFGGRLRFFISGGAPLAPEIARFFHACDVLILEGYGLTETSAATCLNRLDNYRFGTVGLPVPGCEIKIADDGEVLVKSRGVMVGYHNQPDATTECIDADGWLRTGDIGLRLPSGHLKITDRKRDLIITAGGKNIAPANFENRLKSTSLYVDEVVMHGDRRPYCTALISLSLSGLQDWAAEHGIDPGDYTALAEDRRVRALIQKDLDKVNRGLASFETVKKFAILPKPLSMDDGMMTPSYKVKRREVETRYAALLDGFYA